MHPALWINDPDCLLVREHHSELTLDEVIAFASAVGLTGGSVFFSDRVSQLTLERLDIISRLLPPMREHALPMNYFAPGIPEMMRVDITRPWDEWVLLGLFNSEESEREIPVRWRELGLPRGEYHAVEFWSGSYLGLSAIGVSLRVPGHGAAVLAIRARRDEPQLLSTSFHISQGAVEIKDWRYDPVRDTVEWEAQLGREALGTFVIWLPPHLRPRQLTSSSGMVTWQQSTGGQLVVTAEVRGDASFSLELERR
jgi:alpha-galactosidase